MESNNRYKIGTVSKLFGIPEQTLRYYEECGILSTQRDPGSQYRYYDTWDLRILLDTKYLRSMGFPINVIENMVNKENVHSVVEDFNALEDTLRKKIEYERRVLEEIQHKKEQLNRISTHLNRFIICDSPALVFQAFMLNHDFLYSENSTDNDVILTKSLKGWMELMPFVSPAIMFSKENLKELVPEKINYWGGLAIELNKAEEQCITLSHPSQYIPSHKCYYTIYKAGSRGTFVSAFLEKVVEPLTANGYTITGNIIGNIIMRSHENGQYTRFFEVWVPIE